MPNRRALIYSVALGLFAVIMLMMYAKGRGKVEVATGKFFKAVVATQDVERNQIIEEEMVGTKNVPEEGLQPGYYSNVEEVIGQSTIAPILRGEQITGSKLVSLGAVSLSIRIPEAKRAFSISIGGASGVSGLIRPGDHVDILGTFQGVKTKEGSSSVVTRILPNVLVLAVGSSMGGGRISGYSTITFAVTTEEAEMLTFAEDFGKLRLVLRPVGDTEIEEHKEISLEEWVNLVKLTKKFTTVRKEEVKRQREKKILIIKGTE